MARPMPCAAPVTMEHVPDSRCAMARGCPVTESCVGATKLLLLRVGCQGLYLDVHPRELGQGCQRGVARGGWVALPPSTGCPSSGDPPQPFQNAGFTQFHGTLPFSSFQGFDCFLAHGFWQEGFKTNQEFHAHAWSFSTMVS